jgi:hypothetical protein
MKKRIGLLFILLHVLFGINPLYATQQSDLTDNSLFLKEIKKIISAPRVQKALSWLKKITAPLQEKEKIIFYKNLNIAIAKKLYYLKKPSSVIRTSISYSIPIISFLFLWIKTQDLWATSILGGSFSIIAGLLDNIVGEMLHKKRLQRATFFHALLKNTSEQKLCLIKKSQ